MSNQSLFEVGPQALARSYRLANISLRLSHQGHDFAKTLNNEEVFVKLQSELKDAGQTEDSSLYKLLSRMSHVSVLFEVARKDICMATFIQTKRNT
ncbi:hypothetical protein GCM10007105_11940 [Shewanella chilikensis]|nr:hypothetical protein GCM10007105_11940 [Shewanella chilikensis]